MKLADIYIYAKYFFMHSCLFVRFISEDRYSFWGSVFELQWVFS